jgi:predicted esterase
MPFLAAAALAFASLAVPRVTMETRAATSSSSAPAWCAPETEALAGDVCHVDHNEGDRRTLVIFLHGVVPHASTWQWTQQRAILRESRFFHFAAIMPRAPAVGPHGAAGYAWPGASSDDDDDRARIASWREAQRLLEARAGRPFDEVFIVGFSSGAYYATSLALHDRARVDGYVLLAGGSAPSSAAIESAHRAPIFVGVSSKDRATSPAARALGRWLGDHDWPHKVDEEPVGHMVSDLHVVRAMAYLRSHPGLKSGATKAM